MSITLADISEFQSNIDAPAYLKSGHTCVIVRAHNGWRADNFWPTRRDYLRKFKFDCIGYYQYLVKSRDPAQQAHDFIGAVGPLRDNEFVILDLEEGSGSQVNRAREWFAVVDDHYGRPATLYSYSAFFEGNLGGSTGVWPGRPRWLAAYQGQEPSMPHELWQMNDHSHLPGIAGDGGDGNLFHGTGGDMARVFCHMAGPLPHPPVPSPAQPLPKPPSGRENVIALALTKEDRVVIAYEADDGEVLRTWERPDGSFAGSEKGKRNAGWQSLGNPQKDRM